MLGIDSVTQGEFGEAHARLRLAVRRRRRNTIAQRIYSNHEILFAVTQPARADVRLQLLSRSRSPRGKDNRIRSLLVKRAESSITNPAIANYFAASKLEIAERSKLLLLCDNCDRQELN